MNEEELNKRLDTIEGMFAVLADSIGDQQRLQIEVLAHHMATQTALRDFLAKHGEDKAMLDHRFLATYERAKKIVHDHVATWPQSGGAVPPRDIPPILPDETSLS